MLKLFFLQVFQYSVISFSYRVMAMGSYAWTLPTDFIYAFIMFKGIQTVAKDKGLLRSQFAYALGSVSGTALGMFVSKIVTGH
jgi:hypothetical protein